MASLCRSLTTTPKVAIIVLNWNGKRDTLGLFAFLAKLTYANFETLLLFDNGSTDDSVAYNSRAIFRPCIIETGSNLGFAEAITSASAKL